MSLLDRRNEPITKWNVGLNRVDSPLKLSCSSQMGGEQGKGKEVLTSFGISICFPLSIPLKKRESGSLTHK